MRIGRSLLFLEVAVAADIVTTIAVGTSPMSPAELAGLAQVS
jgi:hypothetical protein